MPASLNFPAPTGAKPSDLFKDTSTETPQPNPAGFLSEKVTGEYLIFTSSLCATEDNATNRAVYAIVWGPPGVEQKVNQKVCDLSHKDDRPQTADRLQLTAAAEAISMAISMRLENKSIRSIVVAYQGDYFRNHVAHSSWDEEVKKAGDNLDLRRELFKRVKRLERSFTVRFWEVETDNRAEALLKHG